MFFLDCIHLWQGLLCWCAEEQGSPSCGYWKKKRFLLTSIGILNVSSPYLCTRWMAWLYVLADYKALGKPKGSCMSFFYRSLRWCEGFGCLWTQSCGYPWGFKAQFSYVWEILEMGFPCLDVDFPCCNWASPSVLHTSWPLCVWQNQSCRVYFVWCRCCSSGWDCLCAAGRRVLAYSLCTKNTVLMLIFTVF